MLLLLFFASATQVKIVVSFPHEFACYLFHFEVLGNSVILLHFFAPL